MSSDLRTKRTHKLLRNSLIELLETKPYAKISVQDIVEQAEVHPSTFYRYFYGKSALVSAMIHEFKSEYSQLLQEILQVQHFDKFAENTSLLLFQRRRTMLALWQIDTPRHRLYYDMLEMTKAHFKELAVLKDKPCSDFQATLFTVSLFTTMRYYFEKNQPIASHEIISEWQGMIDIMK